MALFHLHHLHFTFTTTNSTTTTTNSTTTTTKDDNNRHKEDDNKLEMTRTTRRGQRIQRRVDTTATAEENGTTKWQKTTKTTRPRTTEHRRERATPRWSRRATPRDAAMVTQGDKANKGPLLPRGCFVFLPLHRLLPMSSLATNYHGGCSISHSSTHSSSRVQNSSAILAFPRTETRYNVHERT
ncbi:hypothetical protein FB446DRAFT_72978 [Lentinula raphanica]|nr:hypothetical protein FB446DRAFT_72978 [Lentinula raphanica]